jgi:hypothetical protein
MILHAIHADKTFGESGIKGRIIVKSPDTDVLILCIHRCNIHKNYDFIRVLSQTPRMCVFIPVHSICLSPNVLSAWIACKIMRVSASSCVQYNSWQSETPSLQIFLAMIRSTRKIQNFPG